MRWVEDPSTDGPDGYLGAVLAASRRAYPYRTTSAELLGRAAAGWADVTIALHADMLAFAPPSLQRRERTGTDIGAGDDLVVRAGRTARPEPSVPAPANVRRADAPSADPRVRPQRVGADRRADPPPRPTPTPATQMPAHASAAGPARDIRAAPAAGPVAIAPVNQVGPERRVGQGRAPAGESNPVRQPPLLAAPPPPAGVLRPNPATPSDVRPDARAAAQAPSRPGPSASASQRVRTSSDVAAFGSWFLTRPGHQPSRPIERVEPRRDPNVADVRADPRAPTARPPAPGRFHRPPAEPAPDEHAPGRGREAHLPGQPAIAARPRAAPPPALSPQATLLARTASSSAAFPKAVAGVPVSVPSHNPVKPRPPVETVQMPVPRKAGKPAGHSVEKTTEAAPPAAALARGRHQRVPPAAQYVRAPRPSPPAAQWARRTQLRRLELRGRR